MFGMLFLRSDFFFLFLNCHVPTCTHTDTRTCSYDGTVRNSCGDVLQFVYGEDGMDGTAVESQVHLITIMMFIIIY